MVAVGGVVGFHQDVVGDVGGFDEGVEQQEGAAGVAVAGGAAQGDRGARSATGTPRSQNWSFCFHTIPATPSRVEMVTPVTSWIPLVVAVPVSTTLSDHV